MKKGQLKKAAVAPMETFSAEGMLRALCTAAVECGEDFKFTRRGDNIRGTYSDSSGEFTLLIGEGRRGQTIITSLGPAGRQNDIYALKGALEIQGLCIGRVDKVNSSLYMKLAATDAEKILTAWQHQIATTPHLYSEPQTRNRAPEFCLS